jgi:hypothetical protein
MTMPRLKTANRELEQVQTNVASVLNPLTNAIGEPLADIVAPTLLNGWANTSDTYPAARYWVDAVGYVNICGSVQGGSIGMPIFVLPAELVPATILEFATVGYDGSFVLTVVSVDSSGNVTPQAGNTQVKLNGIRFPPGL